MRLHKLFIPLLALASYHLANAETRKVVVVDWIPLGQNGRMVSTLQKKIDEITPGPDAVTLERQCAYGDNDELKRLLTNCKTSPHTTLIAVGDHVYSTAIDTCPDTPLIGVFTHNQTGDLSHKSTPRIVVHTDPSAAKWLEGASAVRENYDNIAIIYTKGYSPNENTAASLEKILLGAGKSLRRILVDPGFCRTETDFEKAVTTANSNQVFDLLIVPSDPNCDRFAPAIFNTAKALNVLSLGSESTLGRGCAAALQRDTIGSAAILAQICVDLLDGKADIVQPNYTVEALLSHTNAK